jgi:hypothetical protein
MRSCRRELLDQVIPANEPDLRRVLTGYVRYFHQDRTHLRLSQGTPNERGSQAWSWKDQRMPATRRLYATDTNRRHSFPDRVLFIETLGLWFGLGGRD